MKRALCLLLSLLIFCSGCGIKSSGVTAVTSGLSFDAKLIYAGEESIYTVNIEKNGTTEITLESGAAFTFSDDNYTVSYEGLSKTAKLSSLNKNLYVDFFYLLFKTLRENDYEVTSKDDRHLIECGTSKYDFTLFIGQSGLPIEVNEKNFGFKAVFLSATLKN